MNKYHYKECGLDNVWLCNGYDSDKDEFGEWVKIDNLKGLHQAIAQVLVGKLAPLTGPEIRFIRTEMDLSQKAFGAFFGNTDQAVAIWEKSEDGAPDGMDYLIRHIYRQSLDPSTKYVDEVQRLQSLDQQDYEDGFCFKESNDHWEAAA